MARDNFFSLLTTKAQPPRGHFITLARKKTVNMCLQNEHIKREKEKETKEKTFYAAGFKIARVTNSGVWKYLEGKSKLSKILQLADYFKPTNRPFCIIYVNFIDLRK